MHPLDRPVWNALATGWASLAQGSGVARRLDPRYGPFAAAVDASQDSLAALAALVPDAPAEFWCVETAVMPPVPGAAVARTAPVAQLLAEQVPAPAPGDAIVPLSDADAPEMRALAALTRPGPFASMTHRFGGFVGIRREGRLVAMAGTRMRLTGFTEVSGVCTHPEHRGQGHAERLIAHVASEIVAHGERAFLHSYPDNEGAMVLYAKLGFRRRADLMVTVLQRSVD